MAPLRVCEGTVSIEQSKTKGSSAPARVQSAGAVTIAAAELMNVRRDIEDSIVLSPYSVLPRRHTKGERILRLPACDAGPSKDESDAGHNEQNVDRDLELPIREPLEDAQAKPRAEHCSRN